MSRAVTNDQISLNCVIDYDIGEWDNGDVEARGWAYSDNMPERMRIAIQDWLNTNEGMDWILTHPRNRKRAAESVEATARTAPNGLRNPQPPFEI